MLKRLMMICGLCLFVILPRDIVYAEGERPWAFSIGAVESFDDNRDGVSANKKSILETRINPRADFKLYRDQADIDCYYSPQFLYRNNPREEAGWRQKGTDLYHDLGAAIAYRWSERMTINAAEAFNLSDIPADMDTSRTFHEFVTYWVNRVNLAATYEILPKRAAVVIRGNNLVKKYRDDLYAETGDEKSFGGGVTARYVLKSGWTVVGDVVYSSTDLGEPTASLSRSADVLSVGAAVERVFGLWSTRLRLGIDKSSSDISGNAVTGGTMWSENETKPGGDIEIAYSTESGMTRVGLVSGYHTLRSDIVPFATQQRKSFELSVNHSYSERIQLGLRGVYGQGEYDNTSFAAGGSDAVAAIGATMTYVWSRNLSVETSYRFEDWKADENIRESYRRNILQLAMKAQF